MKTILPLMLTLAAVNTAAAEETTAVAVDPESAPLALDDRAAAGVEVEADREEETPPAKKRFELGGYIQPSYGLKYRPAGMPRDKWEYGATGSAAGFGFRGEIAGGFSYNVMLVVDVGMIEGIAGVGADDTDGDGQIDSVAPSTRRWSGTLLDTVTISYRPIDELAFKAGVFRIPFTNASSSANTDIMFPSRPGPNQVFLSGSDQGITATLDLFGERVTTIVGAFNGTSLGLLPNTSGNETRGLVYMGRIDTNPLGSFPANEWDAEHGPLRVGGGVGVIYRPATIFDAAGYESIFSRDLRIAASVRAAFRGFYIQAEFLRRQQTDSLTNRPKTANGAYIQSSFYFRVHDNLALQPIARVGYTVEDEAIEPRTTGWLEGGVALFPRFGSDIQGSPRFILQYLGERRISEDETAHGVVGQLQLEW